MIDQPERLYFNTHDPRLFEELYDLYTEKNGFKITVNVHTSPLTVKNEEVQSRSSRKLSPSQYRMGVESKMQKEFTQHMMPIFDVLIFGDKSVGKKCFMQRANEGQ